MATKMVMGIAGALALGASLITAAGSRATGVVTAMNEKSMQIKTKDKDQAPLSVTMDAKTGYMKWVTHQPWMQDKSATRGSVAVGSCVDVDLRDSSSHVAKTVRISVDGPGTLHDPCKEIR
jgi:hypothetical protein